MASEKETTKTATVVEEVAHGGQAVDVLDLDARILSMARECPPFYKNRNLLILYLLVSSLWFPSLALRLSYGVPGFEKINS